MLSSTIRNYALLIVCCLAALAVYGQLLFYNHISWDDPEMVFSNKDVINFDVQAFFKNHYVGNYLPLTMLLHSIDWTIFGDSNAGHHAMNIIFHLFNGFLVYRLGSLLFDERKIIVLSAAVIFLLHPLQTESVSWIAELKNILSTTFYLLSCITYFQFCRDNNLTRYFSSFLFFLAGCLCKSSVVVVPLALLCFDFFTSGKFTRKMWLNKLPYFAGALVFGYINMQTQAADRFLNLAHAFPWHERVGMAGFAVARYLLLFLFPVKLSVLYPYPPVSPAVLFVGYLCIALNIGLTYFLWMKKQSVLLALQFFVIINLVLVLQLIPFGEVLYADRYMYIVVIGLGWMLGILFEKFRIPLRISFTALLLVLALLTFARTRKWKDAITLYEDINKNYPGQFVALNSAGVESMFMNRDNKALDYLNKAVEAAPNNYKPVYNRGLLFLKNGRTDEAIRSFNQTIGLYRYDKAYVGRASAYYLMRDYTKAIEDANSALVIEPGNSKAYFVIANCYNDMNQLDKARKHYNEAIALNGDDAEYFFKRAIVSGKEQNFKACLQDLEVALHLKPDYYEAYYWRGVAKVNLNQNACPDLSIAAQHNFEPAVKAYNKYCR